MSQCDTGVQDCKGYITEYHFNLAYDNYPPSISLSPPLPSPPPVVPNDLRSSLTVNNQDTTAAAIVISPISPDVAASHTVGYLEVLTV